MKNQNYIINNNKIHLLLHRVMLLWTLYEQSTCVVLPIFSGSDRSLNWKSYQFTVHRLDRQSNRYRTGDVINIYFIILYIIKN